MAASPIAEPRPKYRRLPGRGRQTFGAFSVQQTRLWLGEDHLLFVSREMYRESYHRFYFRDIQALSIQRTAKRLWGNVAMGGMLAVIAVIAFLVAWYASPRFTVDIAIWVVFGVCSAPLLLALAINSLAGPICVTRLQTAAHAQELPSLKRLRTARKVLRILKGAIEEVQGAWNPSPEPTPSIHGEPDRTTLRESPGA